MAKLATNKQALLNALAQAITEVLAANPPAYSRSKPFDKDYGPGIANISDTLSNPAWKKSKGSGTFKILATRHAETNHNMVIQVHLATADASSDKKAELDKEPELFMAVKSMLKKKGFGKFIEFAAELSKSKKNPVVWVLSAKRD